MTKKAKEFDCVDFQDKAALRIHETLRGMSQEEELAYWRERSEEGRRKYPALRKAATPAASTK